MTDVAALAGWLRAIGDAEPHAKDCEFPYYACSCDQAERASLAQANVVMDALDEATQFGRDGYGQDGLTVIERAAKEGA